MTECAIVAIAGDLHSNSVVGLMPKYFYGDDGINREQSKVQRFLWNHWLDYWRIIKKEKKRTGYPIVAILNGELADDNVHTNTGIISHNPADQLRLAVNVIEPMLDIADFIFVTRGTVAHTGPEACLDEIVARDIGAIENDEGQSSHWLLTKRIAGVDFHVCHTPPVGSYSRAWTKGGDANRAAVQLIYDYIANDERPPDIAVFNHTHRRSDSYDNHPLRVVINPSFQGPTDFSYRIGGQLNLPIGASYYICENGNYETRKVHKKWPMKKWNRNKLDLQTTS